MPLTKDEVRDQIRLKQVDGVWGISVPTDFVSAEVKINIFRNDKYSKCKQDIEDSIKFGTNSNGELGIKVGKAENMDPDYDNKIGLQTVFKDEYDDNGVALVDFDIGNVSTNYNEGDAPERTETDTLNINENDTFYKFTTLEGRTDGGRTLDYQDYLKNGSTQYWDGREVPDISSDKQTLDFYDDAGPDNNARMTFTSKDVEFNEKPSLTRIEVEKTGGTFRGTNLSNNTNTEISRGVRGTKNFYQINLTVGSGATPKLTSSDRDGNAFYEGKKAILIRDNCNNDNDDGTDYKNTLIFIKSIKNIKLTGTPPEDEDPDPVVVEDPDPEVVVAPETPDPTYVDLTVGGPCPTNPDWNLASGGTWAGDYIPSCAAEPVKAEAPGGALSLTRDPNNKKKVVLSFSDISGREDGRELREQLNLKNSTPGRSLANKLITLKVTYSKQAGWANRLDMTASCSDIRKPDGTFELNGAPYSKPSVSENYELNAPNVSDREWYFYNIDGSSTVDFVFSSTPESEPTRTRYTGQTESVSTVNDNDPVAPTITTTTTITCVGEITEGYSDFYKWPVCPEEVYVTRTGGTTASAVYSDGHHDGANDQYITIELIAIRESAIDVWALESLNSQEPAPSILERLKPFVWVTSSTANNDDNLGLVDGRSLIDYDEHSAKIRFRNPATQTSATDLAINGTSILELEGYSGALYPDTIDTKISNAVAAGASLPINLSYWA